MEVTLLLLLAGLLLHASPVDIFFSDGTISFAMANLGNFSIFVAPGTLKKSLEVGNSFIVECKHLLMCSLKCQIGAWVREP